MPKPTVYDELYPGRLLKAGLLKGMKVTLTIKDVDIEGLEGDDGKKQQKAVLSFEERPMQHVMCKTNGVCIKAMFGPTLANWIGKRVTLFESQWNGEPCIRVWGSPDIPQDQKVTVSLPRRRPFDMVLHAVKQDKKQPQAVANTSAVLDPRVSTAFGILGFTAEDQGNYLADHLGETQAEILADLNRQIEARDAVEA
jgi:hypothetical protein